MRDTQQGHLRPWQCVGSLCTPNSVSICPGGICFFSSPRAPLAVHPVSECTPPSIPLQRTTSHMQPWEPQSLLILGLVFHLWPLPRPVPCLPSCPGSEPGVSGGSPPCIAHPPDSSHLLEAQAPFLPCFAGLCAVAHPRLSTDEAEYTGRTRRGHKISDMGTVLTAVGR